MTKTTFLLAVVLSGYIPSTGPCKDEGTGSSPIEVRADSTDFYMAEGLYILNGNVNIISGDRSLSADQVTYYPDSGYSEAVGNVVLWDRGQQVYGARSIYNFTTRRGVIVDAEYDGEKIFGWAEKINIQDGEDGPEYILLNSKISTCDLPVPHYDLTPGTITIVPGKKITATDTKLRIGDTSVAYLPYFRRSLADHPFGVVTTPGYSSKKGAMLLNKATYHYSDLIRPRLYLDGYSSLGVGAGVGNRYGNKEGTLRGRSYAYYIDTESGNDFLDEEDNIGRDVDEERWKLYGEHYQELWDDSLVLTSRRKALSDMDYEKDFDDEEQIRGFTKEELESDRASFVNLAKRWEDSNLRVLYLDRLHDFHTTNLPDVERTPQVILDTKENPLFDSGLYWESLFSYDNNLRSEQEYMFLRDGSAGISRGDEFLTRYDADRAHGEGIVSLPLSAGDYLRITPRMGVHANSYDNVDGKLRYYDNTGTDDRKLTMDFDSEDQTALQTGVELASRPVFDFQPGGVGAWERLRVVSSPTLSFDNYSASEDLTETTMPDDPFLRSVYPGSYPEAYPKFDSLDFPMRDAQILAFRLESKIQGKKASGEKRNLLVHSLSVSRDFEPSEGGYSDLESELFLGVLRNVFLTSFLDYDLNDDFLRNSSFGVTFEPFEIVGWRVFYTKSKRFEDDDARDYISGDIFYKLGQKYRLGFSSKWDLLDDNNIDTEFQIRRDLHDAIAVLAFEYEDRDESETEFQVSLRVDFKLSRDAE